MGKASEEDDMAAYDIDYEEAFDDIVSAAIDEEAAYERAIFADAD